MRRMLQSFRAHRALKISLLLVVLLGVPAVQAEEDEVEALAKAAQNPLATLTTLPLQANWNSGIGPYDRQSLNLNIQPVVPFPGKKWNVISRTIIPVNSIPVGETDSTFGIGDTTLTLFFSPAGSGKLTWGIGPVFGLPTASNQELLGTGKFSLGPSGVLFYTSGPWTMGAVVSNLWSLGGDSEREDVNFFTAQYFVNFNFGEGWAVGTAPILTANWEADSGNQWTVPFGVQVSKVTRFGNQPVNLLLGYYDNVDHPEGGAESQVRFQVNFLFPLKR